MHNPHQRVSSLPGTREEREARVAAQRWPDVELIVEQAEDPHNIGAMLRTCDAVGIGTVHLVYSEERPARLAEVSETAMSAAKWLTIRKWTSVEECLADVKARGLAVYVTALDPSAVSHFDVDWKKPCAIAMGTEREGASETLLGAADAKIAIPMRGFVQSLNVSVAAAVVMYEIVRQRTAEGG